MTDISITSQGQWRREGWWVTGRTAMVGVCLCVCQGIHSNLLQLRGSTILKSYVLCLCVCV